MIVISICYIDVSPESSSSSSVAAQRVLGKISPRRPHASPNDTASFETHRDCRRLIDVLVAIREIRGHVHYDDLKNGRVMTEDFLGLASGALDAGQVDGTSRIRLSWAIRSEDELCGRCARAGLGNDLPYSPNLRPSD